MPKTPIKAIAVPTVAIVIGVILIVVSFILIPSFMVLHLVGPGSPQIYDEMRDFASIYSTARPSDF
jgi:hypothetical protein